MPPLGSYLTLGRRKRQESVAMKNLLWKASLHFVLACWLAGAAAFAGEESKEAKWESLFNGKDLTGWLPVHDVSFVVTNGNLRLVRGMGWLRTEKQYTNFIFEAEWRALVSEYDSGFFVRAGLEGKPWPNGGWQVNLAGSALGGLVKGNKIVVPAETPRMPLNRWVKFRLEVRGKKITLDVDGERAWEFNDLDADHGYLGIQAEEKSFDFRNLRIQELPSP
jgi:3-keto-disaccharide hydrolase